MLEAVSNPRGTPPPKKLLTPAKVAGALVGAAGGSVAGYLVSSNVMEAMTIPNAAPSFVITASTVVAAAVGLHLGYSIAATLTKPPPPPPPKGKTVSQGA